MGKGQHIERDYLRSLKEARIEGQDDYEAADTAEAETLDKWGRLPREGK